MKYVSTRGNSPAVSFGEAVAQGLAPDGGLYVPEKWPRLEIADFDGANTLPEVAEVFLRPFVAGDPVASRIGEIVRDALARRLRSRISAHVSWRPRCHASVPPRAGT